MLLQEAGSIVLKHSIFMWDFKIR